MPTRILIVEDEPLIALDLKQRLGKMGYSVVATTDSADLAVSAALQHQPDLILMDIRLRGEVTGIEAAAQIKESIPIPLIFLTAHADSATLKQATTTQPFGYVVKPFDNEDLITAIETALNRHQSERALQRALAEGQELTRLKAQFVAIVSHEFRNPLSVMLTAIDLLEDYDQQLSLDKKAKYFRQARASIALMSHLLEDVLILGDLEATKLQCYPAPLNVSTFCQGLISEIQSSFGHAHTIHFIETAAELPTMPQADEKLLRHILGNLLSNAVKYSPAECPITLTLTYQPAHLVFCIEDHGMGIPAEDQENLFTSFHRGSNVKNIQGTGLGLSIVKHCVDVHKGKISVQSQVGVGTALTVIIPCGVV
jgi:signal transduction histidine kinase